VSIVRIPSGPLGGVSLEVTSRPLSARVAGALRERRRRRQTRPVIKRIVPAAEEPAEAHARD
jgi:hypothetical protein